MKRLLLLMILFAAQAVHSQEIFNKARASLNARDTSAAFASFLDAVKAGQKLSESNYYLGAISYAKHNLDDAIKYLQAAYKADDDNIEAVKLLAGAYAQKEDTRNALAQYRIAAKLAPKDCGVAVLLGQALVAVDSMDAAIVQLTRAKECMPDNPMIYLSLGDAYFKIGVKPLAISNYQRASELAPKDRDIQLKVARALTANRQYTEAVKAYMVAEQIDSTYPPPYLEHGQILVRAKLYKFAIAPLSQFTRLLPNDVEGSALYAEALFGAEAYSEAAKEAEHSLKLDSTNVDVWRIRAYSLVEGREYADALQAFAALQRRNGIKQEDYLMMGRAYFGAGKDAEAIDAFQKSWATDSTNCDIFFPLGSLYMKKQDYKKAADMFERKIACDSLSLSAYINAGITYLQQSNLNLPRARELFLHSIDMRGNFLQGRLWLARYYVQVDSFDLAEAQYLEVVKIIGDQIDKNKAVYGEAQRLLGSLYMTKKLYLRSIDAFKKAQSVGADDANTHLSWGQAILQTLDPKEPPEEGLRKTEEALKHFTICIEKDPNNVQGHFWRGECLARSRIPGEDEKNKKLKEDACAEWRKVLKLDPKNEDAKKGLERIGC